MSISDFLEQTILDLVFNGTAYSGQSTVYVKLHIGDPGEACTSNPATHTTRIAATFGAASGGAISNDALIEWTGVDTGAPGSTETISHISLWDAAAAGNALWYGALTQSKVVNDGDTFRIASGDLDISLD